MVAIEKILRIVNSTQVDISFEVSRMIITVFNSFYPEFYKDIVLKKQGLSKEQKQEINENI